MRVICFYLPQYHPIPENDRWWGKGFTDWTNVARCRPRFRGHHQPRLPADLGFYDLRLPETRAAQAELAAEHGIGGFCWYHYWFNGRLLLERPLLSMLESKRPDFPFCLCWANENWTRSWDGEEKEVLIRQDHGAYDPRAHLDWLSAAFTDRRYIRVGEAPLFLIYNPSAIPELSRTVELWRSGARRRGLPDLFLCSVMSHRNTLAPGAAREAGFDASIEFFPHPRLQGARPPLARLRSLLPRAWNRLVRTTGLEGRAPLFPVTDVFSYRDLVRRVTARPAPAGADGRLQPPGGEAPVFPCVFPSWDNSPRRRVNATVYPNDDPAPYGKWLRHAMERVRERPGDERIVFVNSWNEWAEGCQLEPDQRNGKRFLEETRRVLAGLGEAPGTAALPAVSAAAGRASSPSPP